MPLPFSATFPKHPTLGIALIYVPPPFWDHSQAEKLHAVNPEKKYICQKGFLVVNEAQIHNQSPVAIAARGLSHALQFRESHRLRFQPPVQCSSILNQSLDGNSWFSLSFNAPRPAPTNQNLTIISSFASISANQNYSITTNQNAGHQPLRTV